MSRSFDIPDVDAWAGIDDVSRAFNKVLTTMGPPPGWSGGMATRAAIHDIEDWHPELETGEDVKPESNSGYDADERVVEHPEEGDF